MKVAMAALVLVLLCPARGIADDEPKQPKLDDSLKELEWLIGEWRPRENPIYKGPAMPFFGGTIDGDALGIDHWYTSLCLFDPVTIEPSSGVKAMNVKFIVEIRSPCFPGSGVPVAAYFAVNYLFVGQVKYDSQRSQYTVTFEIKEAGTWDGRTHRRERPTSYLVQPAKEGKLVFEGCEPLNLSRGGPGQRSLTLPGKFARTMERNGGEQPWTFLVAETAEGEIVVNSVHPHQVVIVPGDIAGAPGGQTPLQSFKATLNRGNQQ